MRTMTAFDGLEVHGRRGGPFADSVFGVVDRFLPPRAVHVQGRRWEARATLIIRGLVSLGLAAFIFAFRKRGVVVASFAFLLHLSCSSLLVDRLKSKQRNQWARVAEWITAGSSETSIPGFFSEQVHNLGHLRHRFKRIDLVGAIVGLIAQHGMRLRFNPRGNAVQRLHYRQMEFPKTFLVPPSVVSQEQYVYKAHAVKISELRSVIFVQLTFHLLLGWLQHFYSRAGKNAVHCCGVHCCGIGVLGAARARDKVRRATGVDRERVASEKRRVPCAAGRGNRDWRQHTEVCGKTRRERKREKGRKRSWGCGRICILSVAERTTSVGEPKTEADNLDRLGSVLLEARGFATSAKAHSKLLKRHDRFLSRAD
ncbi:hypothetical protein IWZ00DRAFT_264282 [Phyllosticta capitalensis]